MKDLPRIALLAGIFSVLFLLLLQWKKFDAQHTEPTATTTTTSSNTNAVPSTTDSSATKPPTDDLPSQEAATPVNTKPTNTAPSTNTLIDIKTDVLNVKIDRQGGDIVMINLPTYPADLGHPDIPFELLNQTADTTYVAQSGLIGKNGTDKPGQRPLFDSAQNSYVLADDKQSLVVDLTLPEQDGVQITKRFSFQRGNHLIQMRYIINNHSPAEWEGALFGQIKRDSSVPESKTRGMKPFLGAATTTQEAHYKKFTFKQVEKAPFKENNPGNCVQSENWWSWMLWWKPTAPCVKTSGWIAFVQHYFITAWVPDPATTYTYYMRKLTDEDIYLFGFTSPSVSVAPGSNTELRAAFYAGPKDTKVLEKISPYLDLTVDYGWLWWVAKPIHLILQTIHLVIHNWGWSIIVLTLMIKLMLFPLSHTAYLSMGHMRKVAPKMAVIREQCGDNRQKLQEEMLKLYKTEKINPMGGCLPMLLQMPVFISLYWVLQESVEIRQAPFMGWIHDLSVMDPYFVLPIIMGLSMFLQQKMNPPPPDPTQAKVMQFLPIMFTFMFLWFPAGLVLYWVVNNLTSMTHQAYINKLVERGSA